MIFNFTPVPSAGFNPGFLRGATGQAEPRYAGSTLCFDRQDYIIFPFPEERKKVKSDGVVKNLIYCVIAVFQELDILYVLSRP